MQAAAKKQVRWFVRNERPELSIVGFMAGIGDSLRDRIADPSVGAQERVNRLFTADRGKPIPEVVVQAVAQHRDWTRRLRPDASNPKGPEQRARCSVPPRPGTGGSWSREASNRSRRTTAWFCRSDFAPAG